MLWPVRRVGGGGERELVARKTGGSETPPLRRTRDLPGLARRLAGRGATRGYAEDGWVTNPPIRNVWARDLRTGGSEAPPLVCCRTLRSSGGTRRAATAH